MRLLVWSAALCTCLCCSRRRAGRAASIMDIKRGIHDNSFFSHQNLFLNAQNGYKDK